MFVPCMASCITVLLLEMLKLLSMLQLVGEVRVVMLCHSKPQCSLCS